jgi:hypothetical protein
VPQAHARSIGWTQAGDDDYARPRFVETLDERISREGSLNELDAVGWAIRLARRIEALHALGVAHGSISTGCVATESVSRTSRGVLVDLRRTAGQVAYHSPERVRGGALSQADDAWALGVTLYSMLTGSAAFHGGSDDEVRQRIVAGAPAPLAVFDVGDDDLQRILDDVFLRDADKRMKSVRAVRLELEEWHPDPGAKDLAPLDDEDTTEDAERAPFAPLAEPPAAAPAPAAPAEPARVVVRVGGDEDFEDEDDDAHTVLRSALSPDELEEPRRFAHPAEAPEKPAWAPDPAAVRARPRPLPPPVPPPRSSQRGLPPPPSSVPRAHDSIPPDDNLPTQIVSTAALLGGASAHAAEEDDDDARTVMRPVLAMEAIAAAARSAPRPAAGVPAERETGLGGTMAMIDRPSSLSAIAQSAARLAAPASVPGSRVPPTLTVPLPPQVPQRPLDAPSFARAVPMTPAVPPPPPLAAPPVAPRVAAGGKARLALLLLVLLLVTALVTFLVLAYRPLG